MKMRPAFIFLVWFAASCTNNVEVDENVRVRISVLLDRPLIYDERIVIVDGCITVNDYGDAAAHRCNNHNWENDPREYIDVLPLEGVTLPSSKSLPVELCSRFLAYSADYQGLGWLTSEIGLIQLSDRCEYGPMVKVDRR